MKVTLFAVAFGFSGLVWFSYQSVSLYLHPQYATWVVGGSQILTPYYLSSLYGSIELAGASIGVVAFPFYEKTLRSVINLCLSFTKEQSKTIAKTTLVACFVLLNLFFAWTAVFSNQPSSLIYWFAESMISIGSVVFGHQGLAVFDYEGLILFILASASVFYLTKSLLRMLQLVSGFLVILGAEIYILDRSEFTIFVTSYQYYHGFALWLTNELMAEAAIAVLFTTTIIKIWRTRRL